MIFFLRPMKPDRVVRQNFERDQQGLNSSGSYHRVISIKDVSGSDKDCQTRHDPSLSSCLPSYAPSEQLQDIDREHEPALGSGNAEFRKAWSRK
jgi:hypothetical protein